MAYVNVAEWKTNQVCEWLKGLENTVLPYVHSFMNHNVNGQQLLSLRPEDLEHLGVLKLGHQEIILEAVEYLRNFHYEIDRENLQVLAMRLSCQAHSLYNDLSRQTDLSKPVTTQALSDVVGVITAVKPLVRWLDRSPFSGQPMYNEKKTELLKLSLEMATCAQRDKFAVKPVEGIRNACERMAMLADNIIQDVVDPMILHPSTLDLATLKKKSGDDLGFCILPSFHGAHQVAEIKFGSAAHQCGKMEEGDEIVQVNYQTVVGWERKNVLELFRESPSEVLLTLKRRPKHTNIYGQIYIKPYRLPSNKKMPYATRWFNLPSPRLELLTIPDFVMPSAKRKPKPASELSSILETVSMLDTMTTDDEIASSDSETSCASESEFEAPSVRLYTSKPRNLVQRRATITGASPIDKHSRVSIEQFWRELKREHSTSFQLRDKAVSCAHGLDNVKSAESGSQCCGSVSAQPSARPQTCLGIEQRRKESAASAAETRKVQFQDATTLLLNGEVREQPHDKRDRITLGNGSAVADVDKQRPLNDYNDYSQSQTSNKGPINKESNNEKSNNKSSSKDCYNKESIISSRADNGGSSSTKERGRLDKSHSTPTYDLTESDDDFIEKKFEAALDEHHKQQQRAKAASRNRSHSGSSNKTDSRLFDSSIEDLEEHEKSATMPKCNIEDPNFDTSVIIGNVARKISDIEKNLYNRSSDNIAEKKSANSSTNVSPIKTNVNVHIKVNDVDINDNSEDLEADSGNITTDLDTDEESNCLYNDTPHILNEINKSITTNENVATNNSIESSRDSSEDKSESTSSYIEANTTSGSSDGDATAKKFSDIVETIDSALLEKTRQIESEAKENDEHCVEQQILANDSQDGIAHQHGRMIEALSPNVQLHKNALVENISAKYPSPPSSNNAMSPSRPETPRREVVVKPEVKPRLTPPEPPPRKYYTKPAPLNFNVNQPLQPVNHSPNHLQHQQERPKVPERPSVRRDFKKIDIPPEVQPRIDNPPDVYPRTDHSPGEQQRRKGEHLDSYTDFVERSTDFIDEPHTPSHHEQRPKTPNSSLLDPYGYTEIPEPSPKEKPFVPTSSGSHVVEHVRHDSQTIDMADGLCYSRQTTHDNKPRSLEKDKSHERGVVNRAMMVARSMGLHGNSSKSNNSPKSVRKRNTNLAKRRNVAVKDVTPADLEGWLIYRSRGAGGAWTRAWFILKNASLYRFKTQESTKADCLIALSGFTASQATEVKSRKYAFKVYYTGTVFYFAADTEDTLVLWLDAINRATLRAERTSGLFSETDESDGESKSKTKNSTAESKPLVEKTFGSLKKFGKKDSGTKDTEMGGASLDRKYLKFLGSRTQNVPVPTAQFRSYRRVLPTSTPNRKPEKMSSPDLQVTIAGSTFYGLNASQSATDVLTCSQDMGDYRRTTERLRSNRNQRPEELQGFMTLEEFMLSRQEEECQRSANNSFSNSTTNSTTRFTPLNNDHVHLQHRNMNDGIALDSIAQTNGMIYGSPRNEDMLLITPVATPSTQTRGEHYSSNHSFDGSSEASSNSGRNDSIKSKSHKKSWEPSCLQKKKPSASNNYESHQAYSPTPSNREFGHNQATVPADNRIGYSTLDYGERLKPQPWYRTMETSNSNTDFHHAARRIMKNDGHSSSSGDLACHTCSEAIQRPRKEVTVGRNGSFSLADRRMPRSPDHGSPDDWRSEENSRDGGSRSPLKMAAQYPSSPLQQDTMRPMFEMHFDHQQPSSPVEPKKSKGLRNLFGKSLPRPNNLDLPKEQAPKKTLLGSPSLRRAFFRDKPRRPENRNPGDNGVGQNSCNGTNQYQFFHPGYSAMGYVNDSCQDMPPSFHSRYVMDETFNSQGTTCRGNPMTSHSTSAAASTTSFNVAGLDFPPVFEPETYTFSNPSLRRKRNAKNDDDHGSC